MIDAVFAIPSKMRLYFTQWLHVSQVVMINNSIIIVANIYQKLKLN